MKLLDVGPHAEGFVAVGQMATGIIAFGQMATGVVAVGQLARGCFVVGQLAVGLYSVGMVSVGVFGAAGLGVGGRGMGAVVSLIPTLPKALEIPQFSTLEAAKEKLRGGQPVWIAAAVGPVPGVLLDRTTGQPLPIKMRPTLIQATVDAERQGRLHLFALVQKQGGVDVAARLMAAPRVQTPSILGAIIRFATLVIVSMIFWVVVGREILPMLDR